MRPKRKVKNSAGTTSDLIWFLRPTLVVAVCFLLAYLVATLLSQQQDVAINDAFEEVQRIAKEFGELRLPDPTLSPERVAEIQSSALRDPDRKRGTLQCMSFASTDNLEVTGPLENFSRIVRAPKFSALSNYDISIVGTPIYRGDNARVLVTVFADDRPSAFVWVLAKQSAGQFANCWMTDGVFPVNAAEDATSDEI